MTCPASETLAAWAAGEVTLEQQRQLLQHVRGCRSCGPQAERMRLLTGELRGLSLAPPAPAFTASVLAQLRARPARSRGSRLPLLAAAGLAALGLLAVVQLQAPRGELEARGGGVASRDRVGIQVRVHEPGQAPALLTSRRVVSVDAGYSFVLLNRSRKPQHVMLFALDARSEVHWFYPAFLDPHSDPRSLAVPPTPDVQALPEGITPEQPAVGPFQIAALFTAAPLTVSEVEKRIRESGLPALAGVRPAAQLQVLSVDVRGGGAGP